MDPIVSPRTSSLTRRHSRGFTLIEILVVIGIIVILLSILIPVVSRVRRAARVADVQNQVNTIAGAIERYQQDHSAYPGPLTNDDLRRDGFTLATLANPTAGYDSTMTTTDLKQITSTENLVLGLLGGLVLQGTSAAPTVAYDPAAVGKGPMNLSFAKPTRFSPYLEPLNLSWREVSGLKTGKYQDGAGAAFDSKIPEFVDTFTTPMPLLYLRARKGTPAMTSPPAYTATANPVVTNVPAPSGTDSRGHYDYSQYSGYTDSSIGEGKDIDTSEYINFPASPQGGPRPHGLTAPDPTKVMDTASADYQYPYNSYPYFKNPSSPANNAAPRNKDGFILISAGADRVYGTSDDITSFGSVNP